MQDTLIIHITLLHVNNKILKLSTSKPNRPIKVFLSNIHF